MTAAVTRSNIEDAINNATGNPSSGLIHDWTPAIVDAVDELINGGAKSRATKGAKNTGASASEKAGADVGSEYAGRDIRVIKADETR